MPRPSPPGSRASPTWDEEAWSHAKQICRLSARHVEMARALGMNPKKLPKLRPAPEQRWKLPVREFIEECYRERFGADEEDDNARPPTPPRPTRNPLRQAEYLQCWLQNAALDLERWLVYGKIDSAILVDFGHELREVAEAVAAGRSVPQMPKLPPPPDPAGGHRSPSDDDPPPDDEADSDARCRAILGDTLRLVEAWR